MPFDRLTIRPGHPADADALSDLAVRSKASRGYPTEWLEEWGPQLRFTEATFRECQVLVAEDGAGRVEGVIALDLNQRPGSGEIEHRWVDPGAQGRGVGRALVEAGAECHQDFGDTTLGAVHQGEVAAPVLDDRSRTLPVLRLDVSGLG